MDDLATLTAQPKPLTIGGMTYLIHPLTIGEMGKIQAWVDAQYRDPIELAMEHSAGLNVAQSKHIMAVAMELASRPKPKVGTDEADALVRSVEGTAEVLYLGISKGDPTFTREQAAKILGKLTPEQLIAAMEHTEVTRVLGDPKGPTTGGE